MLQSANWQLYRKAWHFWGYIYSERFDIRSLFVLFTVIWKIHLAQKLKLNREHFRAIIFYNFRRRLTQQQYIDELNSIFRDEAPSSTNVYRWYGEFKRDGSSLQDDFRESRLKSVTANQYWKIVMWPIVRLRQPWELVGPAYIQYCVNIWLWKNLFALNPTQFVNRSKKSSCRLV